jgi:Tfp pilus assembly protein PilO
MNMRNLGIAIGAMVLLAIAFYFLVFSPLDEQQTTLEAETASLQSQAQQLRNQLAQLQDIRDNELEIRADLNRLRALIPSGDPAQPSFVRATQLAADASGVSIDSLTFGQPTLVAGATPDSQGLVLAEISVNGIVQGGYFQIVDLFRRLEIEVVRAVQVDTVGITEGTDGFPVLSTAVTGRIFTLLPTAQVQAEPDPAVPPADGEVTDGVEGDGTTDGTTEGADGTTTEDTQ